MLLCYTYKKKLYKIISDSQSNVTFIIGIVVVGIYNRLGSEVHSLVLAADNSYREERKRMTKSALIIIDMQNGFLNPESPYYIAMANDTIPNCQTLLAYAREMEMPVFFIKRQYRPDGSDVELTRHQSFESEGRPLTPGSKGAVSEEFPPELAPREGEYVIVKPRWSAFFHTELDLILRRLDIRNVILAGTTTPNCIRTTCYDGIALDYNTVIVKDCCSSKTPKIQEANIEDMERAGAVIMSSMELIGGGLKRLKDLKESWKETFSNHDTQMS